MTRDEIVAEARSWLRVKWRKGGRDRQGLDCVGLLIMVARAFGVPHEDIEGYPLQPVDTAFLNHLRRFTQPAVCRHDVGLIGVFRQAQTSLPYHVGIFAERDGGPTIINSRADRRCVVEEPFRDGAHGLKLVEVRRMPGMEG